MKRLSNFRNLRYALRLLAGCILFLFLYSCASIGRPSGGPRDEEPPRFVRANPAPGSLDVNRNSMTLEFNELINVKDAFSKVVVSPPSSHPPRISSNGRRVTIQFPDSLLPNTTYTIDFADAIEDVNEANPLTGFSYTFSTGSNIDSLRIAGIVLGAADLEPQKDILVGVHSILADSAFTSLPFERVAKTDDRGRFIIRGLKPGPYRIFALKDANNDFKWDNPEEDIAFYDEIVVPQTEQVQTQDTIWNLKTATVDTIVTRMRTRYLPNDILLPLFNINFKPQYLVKSERLDSTRLSLIFNAPSPSIPRITPINGASLHEDWFDLERTAGNDTLTFWLRDPEVIATDTLKMRIDFDKVLRSGKIEQESDTITFITQRPKAAKPKKKKDDEKGKEPQIQFLGVNFTSPQTLNINAPITFKTAQPLETLFADAIHLEQKVDSIWTRVADFKGATLADSLSLSNYKIEHPWQYGGEYRVRIDSIAATGIYGLFNRPVEHSFSVKNESDYCSLTMRVSGYPDSIPAFVELLNSSGAVQARASVIKGVARFTNLDPASYYARITLDINGNGKFDTGNYDILLQPEIVFYYPKKINIKKNWDVEQSWNVTETPVDMQKPDAIKKNKPINRQKGKQQNQPEEEEEDDDYFDPTRNPFDPNDKGRRRSQYSY